MKLIRTFLAVLLTFTLTVGNASAGRWLGTCFQPVAPCCITDCYSPCEVTSWCETTVVCGPVYSCHEAVSYCHEAAGECSSCDSSEIVNTSEFAADDADCGCDSASSSSPDSSYYVTPTESLPSETVYSEISPEPTPAKAASPVVAPQPILEAEGFSSAPVATEPEADVEVKELEASPEPMFSDFTEESVEEPTAEEPASFNEEDSFDGGLFGDEPMNNEEPAVEEPMADEPVDDLFGDDLSGAESEPMFDDEPATEAFPKEDSSMEEAPMEEAPSEEPIEDSFDEGGLFGDEPMVEEPAAMEPAEDLFGEESFDEEVEPMVEEPMVEEPAEDLFGDESFGEEPQPLFEDVVEEPVEEPAPVDDTPMEDTFDEGGLFGDEPSEETPAAEEAADDLFGGFDEVPAEEPAAPTAPAEESTSDEAADDLFGGFDEEPMFDEVPSEEVPAEALPTEKTPTKEQDLDAVDDLFGDFGAILNEPGGYQSDGTRNWVDNTGSFSCVGRLISIDGNQVKLAKIDGTQAIVPMARLSQADLEFVNRQAIAYYEIEMVRMAQR